MPSEKEKYPLWTPLKSLDKRERISAGLSLPQRLAQWADQVRQWLGDTLGIEETPVVTEKISHTESVPQKIAPTVKRKPTLREQVERSIQQYHQQKNRPARGGYHV